MKQLVAVLVAVDMRGSLERTVVYLHMPATMWVTMDPMYSCGVVTFYFRGENLTAVASVGLPARVSVS